MYGMILIAAVGWVLGTLLGAVAGEVLPSFLTNALGIMLYGMFLAIIIPPARKNPRLVFVIAAAAGLHLIFHYCIPQVSGGFSVIICGVAAAVLAALFFPVEDEDDSVEISENEKEGRPQ